METRGRSPVRASSKPSRGPWRANWYEARATIGCGQSGASVEALAEALARAPWPEAMKVAAEPGDDGWVTVVMTVKGRHAGDACSKLSDLLAKSVPPQWDWAAATVFAEPVKDGIRRWPRLGVLPVLGEDRCASAALWVAGYAAGTEKPQETALDLLEMLGLTVSAPAARAER